MNGVQNIFSHIRVVILPEMEELLINFYLNSLRFYLTCCLISVSCVWFLQYHWNRRRLYQISWALNGPVALPFMGNVLDIYGNFEELITNVFKLNKKYGSLIRIWFGNKLYIYPSDPNDLQIILNSANALQKGDDYNYLKPAMNDGLLTSNGGTWKSHRKIISQSFNQNIINTFLTVLAEHNNIFVENMKTVAGQGKIDIYEHIERFSIDSLSENIMGIKLHDQANRSTYIESTNRFIALSYWRIVRPWYSIDLIFNLFPMSKKYYEHARVMRNFASLVVKEKRRVHEANLKAVEPKPESDIIKSNRKAFLEHLLETHGTKFNDAALVDQVVTFLFAGSDTTANALSYILMLLGAYPEIQEKVYEEQVDIFGNTTRPIDLEDLSKMQYLYRMIKEALRLFLPSLCLSRTVTDDIKLTTCTLPKGVTVVIPLLTLHRDPKLWPDPLKFDPDRFLPEEVQKRHSYAYIPFSGGARNCIGYRYAIMAMKMFLSTFLRTYRVKSDLKVKDIRLECLLMLKPTKGYMVEIELRNGLKLA